MAYRIAVKNMVRRKLRSFLTALSVAGGFFIAVLLVGFKEYSYDVVINISSRVGYGHMTVAHKSFREKTKSYTESVDLNPDKISKSFPDVTFILPRISLHGTVKSATRSLSSALLGMDLTKESKDSSLYFEKLTTGSMQDITSEKDCAVGRLMLDRLQLELYDSLIYSLVDKNGDIVSYTCFIKAVFESGNDRIDSHTLVLPIQTLAVHSGSPNAKPHYFAVYVDEVWDIDTTFRKLSSWLSKNEPMVKVVHWHETQPALWGFIRRDQFMYRAVLVLALLIIGTSMLSCMMISILERKKEIGTMLALGVRPRDLCLGFFFESFCITSLGLFIGALALIPFLWFFTDYGLGLSFILGDKLSMGGVSSKDLVLFVKLGWAENLRIIIMLYFFSLLATVVPVYRALKVNPIEVLRGDF